MNDSRFYIEYWNYYDWLGVLSLLLIVVMFGSMIVLSIDAGKRSINYLKLQVKQELEKMLFQASKKDITPETKDIRNNE